MDQSPPPRPVKTEPRHEPSQRQSAGRTESHTEQHLDTPNNGNGNEGSSRRFSQEAFQSMGPQAKPDGVRIPFPQSGDGSVVQGEQRGTSTGDRKVTETAKGTAGDQGGERKPETDKAKEKEVPSFLNKLAGIAGDAGKWLPSADSLLPHGMDKQSINTSVDHAMKGKAHADAQEKLLAHTGKSPAQQYEPGVHANKDGSSFTAGADGRISQMTTAPTKENPDGLTYKNFQYDKNGELQSYDNPWGTHFARTSNTDKNGFANWKATTADGHPSLYQGANATAWVGRASVDENGFHNQVGGGDKARMFSRAMDGSLIETNSTRGKDGKYNGVETNVHLPDQSTVSRTATYNGTEFKGSRTLNVQEESGKAQVEVDKFGKSPHVVDRADGKEHNEGAKKGKGGSDLGALKDLLNPDKLKALDNVNGFSATRTTNPNEYKVDVDLAHEVNMPPPNVTITGLGPFGGASARPVSGRVGDFSVNVRTTPGAPNRLEVVGMEEFKGKSDTFGPRGKYRGTRDSHQEWMRFDQGSNGQEYVDIKSSGLANPLRLNENNFDKNSPVGRMLGDSEFRNQVMDGFHKLQENVDSFSMKKTATGFSGEVTPKTRDFQLDPSDDMASKLGFQATGVHLNDKVHFDLNAKEGSLSLQKGDMTVDLKTPFGTSKLEVAKISKQMKDGKQVLHMDFHNFPPGHDIYLE